jgi:hypothetical protein
MSWLGISSQLIEVEIVLPVPPAIKDAASVIPIVARSHVYTGPIVAPIIGIRIIAVRIVRVAIPGNPDSDRNTRLRWRCRRESKSTNRQPNQ